MLKGLESDSFLIKNTNFKMRDDYQVSHLSPKALESILSSIILIA